MAQVLPFPSVRRGSPRARAQTLIGYSDRGAERALAAQLRASREAMKRRGIDPDLIEKDLSSLECAIRTEMWRLTIQSDGAA
jgi:hypothetical protein